MPMYVFSLFIALLVSSKTLHYASLNMTDPRGAQFRIAAADILSFDSVGETTPDLYFVVRKDGDEIFRSDVFDDVDFEIDDPVTGRPKGLTRKFGPFRVTDD